MTIVFSTRPAAIPGQLPILTITGSEAGQLIVTLSNSRPSATLNGRALEVPSGVTVSGVDASGLALATLVIVGGAEAEYLQGTYLADQISGREGADTILGADGADRLFGRADDSLVGGPGSDVFILGGVEGAGQVRIQDIQSGDRLEFYRTDNGAALDTTVIRAGDGVGLGLGEISYELQINGTLRYYVGTDTTAGADIIVDMAGVGRINGFARASGDAVNQRTFTGDTLASFTGTAAAEVLAPGDGSHPRGNGTFNGLGGNDIIRGGRGTDTAVMSAQFANVTINAALGDIYTVTDNRDGGQGSDRLEQVELLRLDDRVVLLNAPSVFTGKEGATFNNSWYLSHNSDVAAAVKSGQFSSGLEHYNQVGRAEGRQPNQISDATGKPFSESHYLRANTDVAKAVAEFQYGSGYDHYLLHGKAEGRVAFPTLDMTRLIFDEVGYLKANTDVANAVTKGEFATGYEHFALYGLREGRDPNALFDSDWYLSKYADVARAVSNGEFANAVTHFVEFGWKENRDPSAAFDTSAYRLANADVLTANTNPLQHYLETGYSEGRVIVADPAWFL
jgi:hypothetical protein